MKRKLIGLGIIVVVGSVITATISMIIILNFVKEKEKIMITYYELNYAVGMANGGIIVHYEHDGFYKPFPFPGKWDNKYGISEFVFTSIGLHNKETGNNLSYDTDVDYFSEEFELDGSLRLYNNGRHAESKEFVMWAQNRRADVLEYGDKLEILYREYTFYNEGQGFEYHIFYSLSRQMLDELIKKEANPDYEMDLLSLQEQGY